MKAMLFYVLIERRREARAVRFGNDAEMQREHLRRDRI